MKRFVAITMALVIAACGGDPAPTSAPEPAAEPQATSARSLSEILAAQPEEVQARV